MVKEKKKKKKIQGMHLTSKVPSAAPTSIGHFTVVYLVAKPLIWSEAEGDIVVLET